MSFQSNCPLLYLDHLLWIHLSSVWVYWIQEKKTSFRFRTLRWLELLSISQRRHGPVSCSQELPCSRFSLQLRLWLLRWLRHYARPWYLLVTLHETHSQQRCLSETQQSQAQSRHFWTALSSSALATTHHLECLGEPGLIDEVVAGQYYRYLQALGNKSQLSLTHTFISDLASWVWRQN